MKENFEKIEKKGFTLVETVISVAIFIILAAIVYQTTASLIRESRLYKENTTISSLADQRLEIVRNLPYSQVGTINGNPSGPLPDLPNAATTTVNGTLYQMYYTVSYVDDSADGTAAAGTDTSPNDYKQIKFYIKNSTTGLTSSFLTNVSPKGLENSSGGGTLSVKVFDALGVAVPNAVINITNTATNPKINLTRIADTSGNWIEAGLPSRANSYHVVVSKNGDSTDQTYPITGQNPNPSKPDATILNSQVTQNSFSVDALSNLTINTVNQFCTSTPYTGVGLRGAKLIGTPSVYKFDNTYSSNSSGQINLSNIEWDTYTPSLTTTNNMLYGSVPTLPLYLAPNTNQQISLVYGPKVATSLLVAVKDSVTGNAIASTSINLKKGSYNTTINTNGDGSCPLPGQAMFSGMSSASNYTVTVSSSGYQTKTISSISISGNNFLQVLLNH